MIRCLLVLLVYAMPIMALSSEPVNHRKVLKEAHDYMIVKPSHSYQLLFQPHDISGLKASLQLQWHITN